jgi:hypothetical protein
MSGLVELSETYEQILSRLRSQGFVHPGTSTPYSRDGSINTLTERMGTRLLMYPNMDFGCYTNAEHSQ